MQECLNWNNRYGSSWSCDLLRMEFYLVCVSGKEAEVLACLKSLKHLINLLNWTKPLESDCHHAICSLTKKDQNLSPRVSPYDEGNDFLNIYQGITILKVDRVSNILAHSLCCLIQPRLVLQRRLQMFV
jgi:hypothetical protein